MTASDLLDLTSFAARWTARLAGTCLVLLVLAFALGEGLPRASDLDRTVVLSFAAIAVSMAGLLLAWYFPRIGGGLALFGAIALAIVIPKLTWTFIVVGPVLAGVLHLVGSLSQNKPDFPGFRTIWLTMLGLFIGFVLLSANEILLQQPVFAGTPDVGPLIGEWQDGADRLLIAPDGDVQGTLFGGSVAEARVIANRTRFGRMMHWRTDYAVHGRVSTGRFSMPFTRDGEALRGSVCVFEGGRCGQWRHLRLVRSR